jgi:predicted  nucleic acid-binding Zn-ribbon protein
MDSEMKAEFAAMRKEMKEGFASMSKSIEKLEIRVERVEQHLILLDLRLQSVEERLDKVELRLDKIEDHLEEMGDAINIGASIMDKRFSENDVGLDKMRTSLVDKDYLDKKLGQFAQANNLKVREGESEYNS